MKTTVREWLSANAQTVLDTDPNATGADLDPLLDRLGSATVVGLGESTRFSQQLSGIQERVFRALVERHGFRGLAIQDSARSGARWDDYVRAGIGDPESVLAGSWAPWRTTETVAALHWIRAFNQAHPDDPIRILGVEPPRAEASDYDAVLDYVRRVAPDRLSAIDTHLAPIRTAHRVDEHIQRHRGIHPGRPFVEDARAALALVETLPKTTGYAEVLAHAQLIVDFHANSVAGKGGFGRDSSAAGQRVVDWQHSTGAKVVYWDGIALTMNLGAGLGTAAFRGIGSYLRDAFGTGYASVAIGFHHGDLGVAVAPAPRPELIDALLGEIDLPVYYVDLHADAPEAVRAWLDAPAKARIISGMYDPAEDAGAYLAFDSLAGAFDVLVHIREVTPVHWLPEPVAV
ncbi:erythromycin esterase family protein [Nocardia altamirensis]|uniref:erythromycin esterase family protein n=1 Tax=Nocardia altamirensis TaxID=472158 RepID=UPI000840243F|nr:erythromycin esterase family protein [Nocardia altamirensis]